MTRYANGLLILALAIIPTIFGFQGMPKEMGLSIAALFLALVFLNIEKISRFKGGGFEAEFREVVNKAYAAIEELKDLGLALTSPIVDTMAVSRRMLQFIHLKHKLENMKKIEETLGKLGASNKEIDGVCGTLYKRVEVDHYERIVCLLKESNSGLNDLFEGSNDWNYYEWDKKRVESFITENQLTVDSATREWLTDLNFWLEHKTLKNEDNWQS